MWTDPLRSNSSASELLRWASTGLADVAGLAVWSKYSCDTTVIVFEKPPEAFSTADVRIAACSLTSAGGNSRTFFSQKLVGARRNEDSPNRMSLERHSLLTERKRTCRFGSWLMITGRRRLRLRYRVAQS